MEPFKNKQAPDGDHIPLRRRYLAKHLQLLRLAGVHNVIKSRSKQPMFCIKWAIIINNGHINPKPICGPIILESL